MRLTVAGFFGTPCILYYTLYSLKETLRDECTPTQKVMLLLFIINPLIRCAEPLLQIDPFDQDQNMMEVCCILSQIYEVLYRNHQVYEDCFFSAPLPQLAGDW